MRLSLTRCRFAQAIADAQAERGEIEKREQRTVKNKAEQILAYKYDVRLAFGGKNEDDFNIGYNAATPEVKA